MLFERLRGYIPGLRRKQGNEVRGKEISSAYKQEIGNTRTADVRQIEVGKEIKKTETLKFFGSTETIENWLHEQKESQRNDNQDSSICDHSRQLYAVFDGVGGAEGGQVASQRAKEIVELSFLSTPFELNEKESEQKMREIIQQAHEGVRGIRIPGEERPPGTTAAVLKFFRSPEDKKLYGVIANVGDSRIYHMGHGRFRRITEDHDLNYRPRDKKIKGPMIFDAKSEGAASDPLDMWDGKENVVLPDETDMQAKVNLRKHVTSVLGADRNRTKPDYVDTTIVKDINFGDYFLLMSDGVYDNLSDVEIEQILGSASDPNTVAKNLLDAALVRSLEWGRKGGNLRSKPDDITVVCIRVDQVQSEEAASPQSQIRQAA